jgi:hypothetical protein
MFELMSGLRIRMLVKLIVDDFNTVPTENWFKLAFLSAIWVIIKG